MYFPPETVRSGAGRERISEPTGPSGSPTSDGRSQYRLLKLFTSAVVLETLEPTGTDRHSQLNRPRLYEMSRLPTIRDVFVKNGERKYGYERLTRVFSISHNLCLARH